MHKRLLAWNIVLTVLLVAGFIGQGFFINYSNAQVVGVIDENLAEMNEVMNEHARLINEHADLISEHADLMNGEYLAAIDTNQEAINEINELIGEYRAAINKNTENFKEVLKNLEELSIIIEQ